MSSGKLWLSNLRNCLQPLPKENKLPVDATGRNNHSVKVDELTKDFAHLGARSDGAEELQEPPFRLLSDG